MMKDDPTTPIRVRKERTTASHVDGRRARFLDRLERSPAPEVAQEPQAQPEAPEEPQAPEAAPEAPEASEAATWGGDLLFFVTPEGLSERLDEWAPEAPEVAPEAQAQPEAPEAPEVAPEAQGPQAEEEEEEEEDATRWKARAFAEEVMIRNAVRTICDQLAALVGDHLADLSRRRILRRWQEGRR